MKIKPGSALVVPLGALALGVLFVYMGVAHYGFWHARRGPQAGFYPTIMGLCLAGAALAAAVRALRETPPPPQWRNWLVPLSVVVMIGAAYVVGLLPAIALYLLIWMRMVQKSSWKMIAIVMVAVGAIVYGVFILWLQVPFERGRIVTELTRERLPGE